MGFVSGFEQDVFISYAHVDNQPLFPGAQGWVTHLFEDLPARLHGYLGRAEQLSILMDPKLRGTDQLDDALVQRLRRTAVFVCILTPAYLDSEWCLRELQAFCSQDDSRFGLQVRGQTRAIKVLVTDLPVERHPEPLRGATGYKFFSVEPDGNVRRYRRTEEADRDQRHWDKLEDLARDLGELLQCMKKAAESPQLAPRDLPSDGPVVFIAEVTDDIEEERDQLVRALTQHGIVVLPRGSLPRGAAELEAAVRRDLERARLSIHMLGQFYGKRPEGDERSLVHVQVDVAAAVGRQGRLSRIAWLRGSLDVARFTDARQHQLVQSLENHRFVAVVGSSGCGKSSLARAGVVAALRDGFMAPEGGWRIATMRPGDRPIAALVAALKTPGALGEGYPAAGTATLMGPMLRRGSLGIVEAFRQAALPEETGLFLLVDQFEELFRFRRDPDRSRAADLAMAFVALLLEASAQRAQGERSPLSGLRVVGGVPQRTLQSRWSRVGRRAGPRGFGALGRAASVVFARLPRGPAGPGPGGLRAGGLALPEGNAPHALLPEPR